MVPAILEFVPHMFIIINYCREKHTKERLSLESSISQLQENLCSAKLRLDKETQWRVNNEAMQRKLLEEKSLLLTK